MATALANHPTDADPATQRAGDGSGRTAASAPEPSRRARRRLRRATPPLVVTPPPPDEPAPRGAGRTAWLDAVPVWSARVAVLIGLLTLLGGLVPHTRHGLSPFSVPLPDPARAAVGALATVAGLLLLHLGAGLRRRKRAAWRLAVAACAASLVADLAEHVRHPIPAAVSAALLLVLLAARTRFTGCADPRGRLFAALILVQGIVVGLLWGLVMLWTHPRTADGHSLFSHVRQVLAAMVGAGSWHSAARHQHGIELFHVTLLLWGLVVVAGTVVAWLRSVAPLDALPAGDETQLRAVLTRHGGRDSLGYFALRRDKSVVWSRSGKSAVTYRVVAGVALISGDPIGDHEAWPGAIAEFARLVAEHGWTPAAMGCSELGAATLARELGLSVLALGDEAIVDTAGFTLDGRRMRAVRQPCTRAARAGYEGTVRRVRELDRLELDELRAAANAWRTDPVERGFSMALSRLGDAADGDCVVVTARRAGELAGLLHFVPWGTDGLSLDLMRRDRSADNGLNEYLIAELLLRGQSLGIARVSLNFAMFRDTLERGGRLGAGPVVKATRWVLVVASRWWQIDTLYRFNDKFHPRWEPRFVCFPGVRDVPRVTLAALQAEAFVPRPKVFAWLAGHG